MNEGELAQCCAVLGVDSAVSAEALQKAYVQKSYALIRQGADESAKAQLRAAHAALVAHLESRAQRSSSATNVTGETITAAVMPISTAPDALPSVEPIESPYDPGSFDSWQVNVLAPPLVIGLAILIKQSFFGFFLEGFHVWMHEFGHATVAWLTGKKALPLPIGWTNVSDEKSLFVYFGVLFLLGVMFVAGFRERKIWPMILAVTVAVAQAYMTWLLPEQRSAMWMDFSGVGGEFYLAAALMALFYVQMPDKFRWGACRYVVLFISASTFYATYSFWKKVKRGEEGIPYGTMINGEEDGGGDMNGLHEQFGWTQREIIHTYNNLGDACVLILVVIYIAFAVRLDKLMGRLLARLIT